MKYAVVATLLVCSIFNVALAQDIQCPKGKKVAWGITTSKPKSAEDLRRHLVTPNNGETSEKWDINPVADGKKFLYLSCAYQDGRILSRKLALKKYKCLAMESKNNLSVSCAKR